MSILEFSAQSIAEELLHKRGISDLAIATFRIKPTIEGWQYPVPGSNQILRWKAFDSNAKPKYRWLPTKPPQVLYYHAPDLWYSVQQAKGELWIVSGEPDVWVMYSAGIHNVMCFYGEMSIPATLATDLKRLGTTHVYTAPDLDSTGLAFAQKLQNLLAGTNIELTCYTLPEGLGTGGDIGRVWQWHRDPLTFESWLKHRPLLKLPELPLQPLPETKPPTPTQTPLTEQQSNSYDQIASALGVTKYYQSGFSHLVHCPFHEDNIPSAGWHKQKHILHCFRCGQNYLAKEVAQKLDIEWPTHQREAKTQAPTTDASTASQKPQKPISVSQPASLHLLPTEARETLIQRKLTNVARILDTLYSASWDDGKEFTIYDALPLCNANRIAYRTLYETLQIGLSTSEGTSVSIFSPAFVTTKNGAKNGNKNTQKGRPRRQYRLPSVTEICEWLGINLKSAHDDSLLPDALGSATQYRASVYSAFPSRKPGTYKRQMLADRLGISEPTACRYDKLSGIEVIPRYRRTKLNEESVPIYSSSRQDRPGWEWIEGAKGWPYPPTREGLLRALQSGEAWRVIQLSNHYGPPQPIIDHAILKSLDTAQPLLL